MSEEMLCNRLTSLDCQIVGEGYRIVQEYGLFQGVPAGHPGFHHGPHAGGHGHPGFHPGPPAGGHGQAAAGGPRVTPQPPPAPGPRQMDM